MSTGNIGMRSRTVVQTFDVNWEDKNLVVEDGVLSPYVLFASERLTLSGSANIVGHVGTGSSSVSGANHVTQGYRVDTNVTDTLKMPRFPDLRNTNRSLSGNQTLSRHEDFARYNSITIGNQRKLTVNVGNEPRELQVGSFSIENHNNSILEIVGDGFLTIYVENDLDLTGRILPASSNLKVAFIVEGDVTIDARGNSEIRAFIFAPNSSINISGNTSLHGTLIARNINMGGASSAYIPLHISDVGPVFPDIGRIGEGPATLEDLLTDVSNVREQ
ncbi:MAG: hypothetical protein LRY73_03830 [Bacillus sp. (in: Bacteria)]|nr:hypothetical protein [Bacillus sp. (in: firmicutes)]